ncbi:hypothetical protein EV652_102737 [Kribbella steppae]|uniref:Uncharacterized protein n=1 Tax=Kribbella steppae TaxID=2512223 RepID=A0A4R2HUF5_9ACTN|nr:hypothetical protein [Kribbella steppae]TCO34669.1 hypothetical protein EV652_102737 [Kribbella steppae]
MSSDKVQWPGKAVNASGDDLSGPVQQFLRDLRLLEKKSDVATVFGTPASLQVITAGATSLGKVWPSIVAAIGGGSAILTGLMGFGVGPDGGNIVQRAAFTVSACWPQPWRSPSPSWCAQMSTHVLQPPRHSSRRAPR